ncbi:hypothetical protein DFQ12_0663 [Sphingobacterium detergens]|uniref:Uncharacterized protein n=1 Tax=Sphingobacterium detergens TaxID=1145106 RepID=A0A420BGH2_SPHD1|nr:hypothetical protein DFQ12_0663 [Sphingobacterium detergens]
MIYSIMLMNKSDRFITTKTAEGSMNALKGKLTNE